MISTQMISEIAFPDDYTWCSSGLGHGLAKSLPVPGFYHVAFMYAIS